MSSSHFSSATQNRQQQRIEYPDQPISKVQKQSFEAENCCTFLGTGHPVQIVTQEKADQEHVAEQNQRRQDTNPFPGVSHAGKSQDDERCC